MLSHINLSIQKDLDLARLRFQIISPTMKPCVAGRCRGAAHLDLICLHHISHIKKTQKIKKEHTFSLQMPLTPRAAWFQFEARMEHLVRDKKGEKSFSFFFRGGGTRGRLCGNSESGLVIASHPSSKGPACTDRSISAALSNQRGDDSVHCWVSYRLLHAAEGRKMKYLS